MKKIFPALLIAVALILGGGLVYLRGGGMGLEQSGSDPSIQEYPNAMPAMCKVEQIPTPDPTIKQQANLCVVEFPDQLQVVPYCANKKGQVGAVNITLPQGSTHFVNVPKNCTVLVDDEKLYAKTIVCSGPAESKITLTVENSCTPPDANLPVEVKPSCPPDFKVTPLGGCELQVPKNAPTCPKNSVFLASQNCCVDDKYYWTVNGVNGGIRACPEGYAAFPTEVPGVEENTYEKTVNCIRESSLTNTTSTRTYTVVLGSCKLTPRGDADKPVPCIIDPASGTCK